VGKIVVTSFMSVDGVMESPEKWSIPYWNSEIEAFKDEEMRETGALLLGRKTYDVFAESWPSRTGEYADCLNGSKKYVVSRRLEQAQWGDADIIGRNGTLREELDRAKKQHPAGLLVHGSHSLVQTLAKDGLIDQYNLLVYPVVLGQGKRLFESDASANLKLARSDDLGSGVVLLVYRRL
jgi:dihydrofolate reductase